MEVSREGVIGSLLLAVLVLGAGGLWFVGRTRGKPVVTTATAAARRPPEEARLVWQGPHPAEVAEKFTTATTHSERLKWVRQPEVVGPAMEAFFREGPGGTEKVTSTVPLTSGGGGEVLYEHYLVRFEQGEARLLCVSVDPKGAKIDFEAYARRCSESWADLLSGAVAAADEVRVILRPGGFFLHRFSDEQKWRHFKASTPELPDSLDFYAERGGPVARELALLGDTISQMTVSIRAVEDSAKFRQFEITAIKATGWVEPEE